jgi:hypothetical protein
MLLANSQRLTYGRQSHTFARFTEHNIHVFRNMHAFETCMCCKFWCIGFSVQLHQTFARECIQRCTCELLMYDVPIVCVSVCIRAYTRIYTYIYIYIHVHMHACTQACINAHKLVYVHTCVDTPLPFTSSDSRVHFFRATAGS